jgi:photosystem II stability/assembly factor-like uncharacterized protein
MVSSLGRQARFPVDDWVSFSDEQHGLMIVAGRVVETVDGGETWTKLTEPGEVFEALSCAAARCVLISDRRIAEVSIP